MRNIFLLPILLFCFAFTGFGQEPEVKIVAMPDNRMYDQVVLKNGTSLSKVIVSVLVPGEKLVVLKRRKVITYAWSEIQQVGLSQNSLKSFSANWGKQVPVVCDSTVINDRVVTSGGQAIEGTIYEFNPYYRVKLQTSPFSYRTIDWSELDRVVLAKASPFLTYSTEAACRSGKAHDKLKEKTDFAVKNGALKMSYEKELSSEQLRKAWAIRGGTIFSKEYNVAFSMMSAKPSGMEMKGYGYGMNGALTLINLTPPNFPDNPNCLIYRVGASAGLNAFFTKIDMPQQAGMQIDINNSRQSTIVLGLNFGVQQAMGKFLDSKTWKGLAMGLAWRPTYQYSAYSMQVKTTVDLPYPAHSYTSTDTQSDSNSDLNLSGFEIYFDFVNLQAITNRYTKPAHFKVNFFFLPPVGDMKMMFMQIGFGMVTY